VGGITGEKADRSVYLEMSWAPYATSTKGPGMTLFLYETTPSEE